MLTTHRAHRPVSWMVRATALALLGTLVGLAHPPGAAGAPGPAPDPGTVTVVSKVHADAISTFLDAGQLTLGSQADTPDPGTRYAPEDVWFHVGDESKKVLPSGYEFVAPVGDQVWMAPESSPGGQELWPGFSTEGVPSGAIENNTTTLSLTGVEGPGDLEVFTGGGITPLTRLWSSDEAAHSTFVLGRTHRHANWAFTQPGTYRLTVKAAATIAGTAVSDTATYTWVVGSLPEQASTTTTLTAPGQVVHGAPVALSATVLPASVVGAVEFRRGASVLGHDTLEEGVAKLDVTDLAIGSHEITAVFVPGNANLAAGSTSAPVSVTVTGDAGTPFTITGVEETYQAGATVSATATGVTLDPTAAAYGQMYRWLMRPVGTGTGATLQTSASPTYSKALSVSDDGYELSVTVRSCANASCSSGTVAAQTPWVPIDVEPIGSSPVVTLVSGDPTAMYPGDAIRLEGSALNLAEGEVAQWVRRTPSSQWSTTLSTLVNSANVPQPNVLEIARTSSYALLATADLALRVLRDGVAVRQSEPIRYTGAQFGVLVTGLQGLYLEGTNLSLTAEVDPVRPGDDFVYQWQFSKTANFSAPTTLHEGSGADRSLEHELNVADHNAGYLRLQILDPAFTDSFLGDHAVARSATMRVYVTDDPDAQLFLLDSLAGHYHQGGNINLKLTVAPDLQEDDQILWEWKWPGTEWATLPGASGQQHTVTAEQALNHVQVRATLDFAEPDKDSIVTAPVTIEVDDHGAAARQKPTIGGPSAFTEGESLALTRELPANGPTILTEHRWERQAAGSQEWTVLEGQGGAELALPATLADDGASYRVSILKPGGELAYGPSAPATVTVTEETATALAIAGVKTSYDVGEVLRARVVGHDLTQGQSWRWIIRPVGASGSGYVFYGDGNQGELAQGRIRQMLDVGHDGYEIRARLRDGSAYVEGKDTDWVTLSVAGSTDPVVPDFPAGPHHVGERIVMPLSRALGEGESVRLVYRSASPWFEVANVAVEDDVLTWQPPYGLGEAQFALQLMRGERPVAMSAPVTRTVSSREVIVQGLRGVYRVGNTLSVSADVFPPLAGMTYQWQTLDLETYETTTLKEATGPEGLSFELPMTMDWDEQYLFFSAVVDDPEFGEITAGFWSTVLQVSDAPADQQLLFFNSLGGHYHQGGSIDLNLIADPGLGENDKVTWQWKWPGTEWATLPGASGTSHELVAEQALDGVQVRALLDFADPAKEPMFAEAVTIHVDDHGAAARQKPTVGGDTSVVEGEVVTLSRVLPDNGGTLLAEHRWERRAAGSEEWTVLEGEEGVDLAWTATPADDGASYRVSILKPDGSLAYGPSPEVTLAVQALPELSLTTEPAITGALRVGETVHVEGAQWSATPDDVVIEWLGKDHTGSSYTIRPGDLGEGLQVEVRATKAGHRDAAPWRSSVTAAVEPGQIAFTEAPSATGTAKVGETLTAHAGFDVEPDEVHYQWYTSPTTPIDGATGATYQLRDVDAGSQVHVEVWATKAGYNDSAKQSSTPSAAVAEADPTPVATSITVGSVRQVYGRVASMRVQVSPTATGQVSVKVGSRTVSGTLIGGRATVTLPARALAPGRRSVVVAYAGAPGAFEPATASATVLVVKASPTIAISSPMKVKRGRVAVVKVAVRAAGVEPRGVVSVRVAGRVKAVRLDDSGRATVRVRIKRSTAPRRLTAVVTYGGDRYVAGVRATTRIRIVR